MSDYHELFIEAGGYQVAAVEYGNPEGHPVLALHGWLDNAASFSAIAEYLDGIRLIALDLIGHGRSEHRPDKMPYHIWDNVADLVAIMDALNLEKADLVGHSMGASVAMLFAATFPERVERLMLIEGLGPLAYEVEQLPVLLGEAISKRNRMVSKKLKPYRCWNDAVEARMNGRWPVSREAAEALLERGLIKTVNGYIWSNDHKLLMPSMVRFSPEQIRSFLRSVKAPVLVVIADEGAADSIIDRWLSELQHADTLRLAGGHHLHLVPEVAETLADHINQWA